MSGTQGAAGMRSIRPYKTGEEYLYAMKEDLAEWLKELYGLEINVRSFVDVLETGTWLCRHANNITQVARDFSQKYLSVAQRLLLPTCGTSCNELAQPGTFQARDNVSNFIHWCRKEMDIKEVLMFETEDLVLRKNEKNFVLCLLEVARRSSRFGMSAPTLIQMEEEIEEEIREDMNLPPEETPLPKPQRRPSNFKNLDQMVQHLVSRCSCPIQFSMVKVSEGKYRVGDSSNLIFVRILRHHVMVRVGGGWDTLEHYLDKHDPCRCTSLSHKQALKMASPQRAHATQVQHEITARLTAGTANPNKPQPALIVSRSQSPLPPVEWRTYVPHGTTSRKVPASSPPPNNDSRNSSSRRKAMGPCVSHDTPGARKFPPTRERERSATPSWRFLATEERPGSRHAIPTPSGRQTDQLLPSSRENGSAENDSQVSKALLEPQRERAAERTRVASPQKELSEWLAPAGTASGRDYGSKPPGSMRQEGKCLQGTRPSTPSKLFQPASQQPGNKNPVVKGSLSPVKSMHQVPNGNGSAKTTSRVGLTSYRPPAPHVSNSGEPHLRKGCSNSAKDATLLQNKEARKDEAGPASYWKWNTAVSPEVLSTSRSLSSLAFGNVRRNSGHRRKDFQILLEQEAVPGRPGENSKENHGDSEEQTRVYTPLPINLAKEQALYRNLEDEIMSNIKELEEASEDSHQPKERQISGFSMGSGLKGDILAVDCNGPKAHPSTFSLLQSSNRALVYGEGVPRSGVYVPQRESRWHPVELRYDSVIQELSRTLHRELEKPEDNSPQLSSAKVERIKQANKDIPERGAICKEKCKALEDGEPSCMTHQGHAEVNSNSSSSQAVSSEATNSPESTSTLETPQVPLSKPRRSLKKPERVPSIYKLKLRPKIRPRRDNRPEKRPSKIPTPVAYRHAQRMARTRGQRKTPTFKCHPQNSLTTMNQSSSGNGGPKEEGGSSECSQLTVQEGNSGRKTVSSEVKMGLTVDEETWV